MRTPTALFRRLGLIALACLLLPLPPVWAKDARPVELPMTNGKSLTGVVEETNDPPAADPAYAKPVKSRQLDSMLGNLQEDMNKQGITTTQKGMCGACDKPIVGQVRCRRRRSVERTRQSWREEFGRRPRDGGRQSLA